MYIEITKGFKKYYIDTEDYPFKDKNFIKKFKIMDLDDLIDKIEEDYHFIPCKYDCSQIGIDSWDSEKVNFRYYNKEELSIIEALKLFLGSNFEIKEITKEYYESMKAYFCGEVDE